MCPARYLGRPLDDLDSKDKLPRVGLSQLLGYFRLEAGGTRTSRFLRKFFLEALSAR